jgi:integrase
MKALRQAGLPDMRFHDLRHSSATILLAMKIDARLIQERLGHSDITVTLGIYGHVLTSMQHEAMEAIDRAFQASH